MIPRSRLSTTDLVGVIMAMSVSLVLALLLWWPIRFMPYHHTSATETILGAEILSQRNFQPPAIPELALAKPPVLSLLLAGISNITPVTRPLAHSVMIPVLVLTGTLLYGLVRRYSSASVALLATTLAMVLPIHVNQFQVISSEPLALALWLLVLLLWTRFSLASVIVASVAILVKPELAFGLPVLLLFPTKTTRTLKSQARLLLVAVLPIMLWYWYYYDLTGVIIAHTWPEYPNPLGLVRYVLNLSRLYLFTEARWVLTIPTLLAIGANLYWRTSTKPTSMLGFLVMAAVMWIGILLTGSVELSELLVPLVLLLVSGTIALYQVSLKLIPDFAAPLTSLLLLGLVVFQLPQWWQSPPATGYWFRPFTNLTYQHVVTTGRQVAAYLSTEYQNAEIVGGYPESYQLTQPYLGYVEKPLTFQYCSQFEFKGQENVVVFHRYHRSQMDCAALRDRFTMVPLERFVSGEYAVELYTITGESSASPSALEK